MYKLLKPMQKGFNAMLQELEGYIADTGLDRVKMLQNENVCIRISIFLLSVVMNVYRCF